MPGLSDRDVTCWPPGIGEPRPAALEHRISRVAIDPSLKPARTATLRGVCQAFVPHFAQGSRIGPPDPAHPVPGEAASNARTEIQPAGARAVLGVRPTNKGQAACNNPGLDITIFRHRPAIEKHGPPFLFGIILGLPPRIPGGPEVPAAARDMSSDASFRPSACDGNRAEQRTRRNPRIDPVKSRHSVCIHSADRTPFRTRHRSRTLRKFLMLNRILDSVLRYQRLQDGRLRRSSHRRDAGHLPP